MTTRADRAAAALVLNAGPVLAEAVATALAGYRRDFERAGRHAPAGFDELAAAIGRFTVRSRHLDVYPVRLGENRPEEATAYLIPLAAVAEVAGCSLSTIERARRRGEVPVVRLGRRVLADPVAVLDWLETREEHNGPCAA